MKYKAVTYYNQKLKHIDNGGHSQEFESDRHIVKGDRFNFTDLFGSFKVYQVTIDPKKDHIHLLCSPEVRFAF